MATKNTCCCGGCNVRDRSCNACTRCKPKYLCVEVIVAQGTGTGTDTCCLTFGFRMPYDCGGYAGSGSCSEGISLDINVRLVDTAEGCTTVVSSSLLPEDLTFEGTLPAISFTVENEAGDSLDVTIGGANVVENPLTKGCNPPCTCAMCLPGALCIRVAAQAHIPDDPALCGPGESVTAYLRLAITALFDGCSGWTVDNQTVSIDPDYCPGTPMSLSLSITLMADQCAIHVVGTLGEGTVDEIIFLEGPLAGDVTGGVQCTSEEALAFTLGTIRGSTDPQPFVSLIDETFTFINSGTGSGSGDVVGFLRIMDLSCGICEYCGPEESDMTCCDGRSSCPATLTLTCDLGSVQFGNGPPTPPPCSRSWGQQGAGICFPGQMTPYAIVCAGESPDAGSWALVRFSDGPAIELTGSCDPVLFLTGGGFTVTE